MKFLWSSLFLSIIHIFLVKIATRNKRVSDLLKVTEVTLLLSQPLSELPRLRRSQDYSGLLVFFQLGTKADVTLLKFKA